MKYVSGIWRRGVRIEGGTPYTCIRSMSRIPYQSLLACSPLSPLYCFISDTQRRVKTTKFKIFKISGVITFVNKYSFIKRSIQECDVRQPKADEPPFPTIRYLHNRPRRISTSYFLVFLKLLFETRFKNIQFISTKIAIYNIK